MNTREPLCRLCHREVMLMEWTILQDAVRGKAFLYRHLVDIRAGKKLEFWVGKAPSVRLYKVKGSN